VSNDLFSDEPASPAQDGGLVRIRIDLAYDGTDFVGWAKQPGLRSVQGELDAALEMITRLDSVSTTVAGRTDAGVHARGQVVHVDVSSAVWDRVGPRLDHRLNALTGRDIVVSRAERADPGFNARFSALSRRYSYRVADDRHWIDPLRRHEVVAHRAPLDLDAMNEAASKLVGLRDFAAFCRKRPRATTTRTLLNLHWHRDTHELAVLEIRADAFCHSMVRALVGAMLMVGDGRREVGWLLTHANTRRRGDVRVAPPHGLVLEEITYPPPADLAAQALATRARRA